MVSKVGTAQGAGGEVKGVQKLGRKDKKKIQINNKIKLPNIIIIIKYNINIVNLYY